MFSNILGGAAGFPVADLGDEISKSVRFRGSQHLSRSGLTADQSTTFSMWFKFGKIGIDTIPLSHSGGGGVNQIVFNATGTITGDGTSTQHVISSSVHRDPSAWYHLVYTRGTSNTRLFINGAETPYGTNTVGTGTAVTSPSLPFTIGTVNSANSLFFDGYIADVHFIDGQQLLPTEFGRYQEHGVWVPKNYTGTYGTNGFHLDFADSSDLGNDVSGNNNDFTASGFDTAAISSSNFDNDIDYLDTPTSNYATLNPLSPASGTLSEANLSATSGAVASTPNAPATIRNLTSGDWYFEFDGSNGNTNFGIAAGDTVYSLGDPRGGGTQSIWFGPNNVFSGVSGSIALSPSVTFSTHILGIRINIDAGEITFYGEGTSQGTYTFAQINTNLSVNFANKALSFFVTPILSTTQVNWGQRPFVYLPSGLTNTGNLQTNNLPEPTIKNGKEHFQAITGAGSTGGLLYAEDANDTSARSVTRPLGTLTDPSASGSNIYTPYSGNGSTYSWIWDAGGEVANSTFTVDFHGSTFTVRSSLDGTTWNTEADAPSGDNTITSTNAHRYVRIQGPNWGVAAGSQIMTSSDGLPILSVAQAAFSDGLYWIKDRQNSNEHQFVDSVRGSNLALTCPTNGGDQAYSAPSGDSVAWCWNYDSSDPSINGFEIITYTGNATVGRTVSHNLGKAPDLIITKERDNNGTYWCFYHSAGGVGYGYLNYPLAYQHSASSPVMWTATSSTNWTYDANGQVNGSGTDYVSYAWTSVPGYSAFGSYEGNGVNVNGPFIYTGFRPALVMIKNIDAAYEWMMYDTARNPENQSANFLTAIDLASEQTNRFIDILSNGFKCRDNSNQLNKSGHTHIYMAFAENPFGGENAPPATAR